MAEAGVTGTARKIAKKSKKVAKHEKTILNYKFDQIQKRIDAIKAEVDLLLEKLKNPKKPVVKSRKIQIKTYPVIILCDIRDFD